jgi:Fe-S-cluster-containing hydrogenase component 2
LAVKVDMDLCTGCGACVEACPVDAITIEDGKARINAVTCVECGVCEDECPADAISVE